MKEISLLLLRVSTGIYLILWGAVKIVAQDMAAKVSDTYYGGLISAESINLVLGSLQVLLGLLVVLGLFRRVSYLLQAGWYLAGLIPIWAYIIDPFAVYIAEAPKLTFFPSTTLLFASVVIIAFKEFDTLSIDHKRA